jgi:hypothetical protein
VAVRAFLSRGGRRADNRYAANEIPVREVRSFAADVLEVFGDDEKLWGETIAERLRASFDDAYGSISEDAVLGQLRNLPVEVKSVRETGKQPSQGCERTAVAEVVGV